jgi:acetyltransferase-like isoleucine patch superfamily enzyme
MGRGVWIGYDVILETGFPSLISMGDNVSLGIRTTVIAHFKGTTGVRIDDDAFIGPGVVILPNVTIGRGAVVAAGSVVNRSVAPMTFVQGNPAVPIARCGIPLTREISLREFTTRLKPLRGAHGQ